MSQAKNAEKEEQSESADEEYEAPIVEEIKKIDRDGEVIKQFAATMMINSPDSDRDEIESFNEGVREIVEENRDELGLPAIGIVLYNHLRSIARLLEGVSEDENESGGDFEDQESVADANSEDDSGDEDGDDVSREVREGSDEKRDPTFV